MPPENNSQPATNKENKGQEPGISPLRRIRTYQGDIAEALKKQDASLVSIQRAEEERRRASKKPPAKPTKPQQTQVEEKHPAKPTKAPKRPPTEEEKRRKRFLLLLSGGVALVLIGGIFIWFSYGEFISQITAPKLDVPESRLITSDSLESVDALPSSRQELINTLLISISDTEFDKIRHVSLPVSTSRLFEVLSTNAPGSLLRSFEPLFMWGSYWESPFLIIKLSSFENAYAGMLNWEKDMYEDIGEIFVPDKFRDLLATSTTQTIPEFVDITDRNKDIRALVKDGETLLMYSFFDNKMLVITDDISAMRVLIDRLNREKLSR